MRTRSLGKMLAFALLLFVVPAATALAVEGEPDLELAEQLVREDRAQEAFDLLEPYEQKYAGELKYDYLLGLAALGSGQPDRATLIFERVLAVEPRYLGVRMDLARSYYQLGDIARATREFQTVLANDPPPDLMARAETYLQAMQRMQSPNRLTVESYIEMGGGYDSNVNSATSINLISLPSATSQLLVLDDSSLEQEDVYATLAAGSEAGITLSPHWSAYIGGDLRYRAYEELHASDYGILDGRAGLGYKHGRHLFRAGGTTGRFFLDDSPYRKNYGGNTEWRYQPGDWDQVDVSVQYASYRHLQPLQETSDFDQLQISVGWLHILASSRGLFSLNATSGKAKDAGHRADGDADLVGARLFFQLAASPQVGIFFSAGALNTEYKKTNELFLVTRSEWTYDTTIGANWQLGNSWSLRPQLTYIKNTSNISLYSFSRVDAALNLRRDLR